MKHSNKLLLTLAITSINTSAIADHNHEVALDPVVVTTPSTDDVLTVTTDAKAPRQPIPAHDGADVLKNIPGFAVIRKGGSDGDPMFRGMAASRLGILVDGANILGGCGMRMDPPTAYIYPESFDTVTVLKGPQTVKYGAGNSAGTVLFEKDIPDFTAKSMQGYASAVIGSADRNDQAVGLKAGNSTGYLDLNGTRSDANNYKDGNGNEVHSAYTRWNGGLALGWTPSVNSVLEISTNRSDGKARYGDRMMDGVKFDRENYGLKYKHENISDLIAKVEAQIYYNYVDHVMDNFSLRPNSGMKMANNPDRETQGARLSTTLNILDNAQLDIGADWQDDRHAFRGANNMMDMTKTPDHESAKRVADINAENFGFFTEWHQAFESSAFHLGTRLDKNSAKDLRDSKDSNGQMDNNTLKSGFARYEYSMTSNNRLYAGLGHSERAADYWERTKHPAATSNMMKGSASTFDLETEKLTQLDIGILHQSKSLNASISTFYAQHDDYILIEALSMVASNARNIKARTWGAEMDASYQFLPHWNTTASFALTRGENETDKVALGQIPAMEGRMGLNYDNQVWTAGMLVRLVDDQKNVSIGQGNIVGQDLGESKGYAVTSLNAGYRAIKDLLITAGIDNVFDKAYAEHISRNGANITGYEQTTRVNEPGRTWWLKAQYSF